MKVFIIILYLSSITTAIFSKESYLNEAKCSYDESPPDDTVISEALQSMSSIKTTQIKTIPGEQLSKILFNNDEDKFATFIGSKFYLMDANKRLNQFGMFNKKELFDYKKSEGYIYSNNNRIEISQLGEIKENDQVVSFLIHPEKNISCANAFFNPYRQEECFTATTDGAVKLWNYNKSKRKQLKTFVTVKDTLPQMSYNSEKNLLLANTSLKTAALFDQRSEKHSHLLKLHNPITALTHYNNTICFTCYNGSKGFLHCIDERTLNQFHTNIVCQKLTQIAIHPLEESYKILIGTDQGHLYIINSINNEYCILDGHSDAITYANWSSQGHALSTSTDKTGVIWSRKTIHNLKHAAVHTPFTFSEDDSKSVNESNSVMSTSSTSLFTIHELCDDE